MVEDKRRDSATQRAWSWHKQGLDGSLAGSSAAAVFNKAGWARSVGGANPYLTLFARAGIRREQADADVAAVRIHELPTARGCTYVQEVDELEAKTLELLQTAAANGAGALDPQQHKDQLGDAVRSLGEEGKKKGASTTLPTVLGVLQADGRIRRVSVNGRLDQQRYAYTAWGLAPAPESPEQVRAKLMERYLGWAVVAARGRGSKGQLRGTAGGANPAPCWH